MDPFDRLAALARTDPAAAAAAVADDRAAAGDFRGRFYARLMQARLTFGAPPFPDGPASDIPAEHHDAYEAAIRSAAREAGHAHLERGQFREAWAFFRMIGEPEPVKAALASYAPGDDGDPSAAVEVAWHHAVLPERGFDLALSHHGLCAAITLVQGSDLATRPELRQHCVAGLVRGLHAQLSDRLGDRPIPDDLPPDAYHVDPSHLLSVAQLAMNLTPCPEVKLARELCAYGRRLDAGLRGRDDPPFADTFADYGKYLAAIDGHDVEAHLDHFRAACEAGAAGGYRFPAEVLVSLLDRCGRAAEALAVARQHLADDDARPAGCPGPLQLARKAGDFAAAAEVARERGRAVDYVAAVIAGSGR